MQLTTYIFIVVCAVLSGVILGAIYRRDLLFAWRESARRWKINTKKLLEYNHNLAQESFGLRAELEAWKDHYNQAHAAEIKLREQVYDLRNQLDA